MTKKQVLSELKRSGTAQNRKIYSRHGVGEQMFGVSFSILKVLAKKIKTDHKLSLELWATGIHDAMILATMVAHPEMLNNKTLEAWSKDLNNYVITDSFAGLVKKTSLTQKKMEKWVKSSNEWISACGFSVLSHMAMQESELNSKYFEVYLKLIESKIHKSKNRVRHSMNGALISIGIRNIGLRKKAIAVAKRIGKVEVDHGKTSCTTPDAVSYIEKTWDRKNKKK